MPRSRTRKPTKPKPKPVPNLDRPIAGSVLEAEAQGGNIAFEWRGIAFVVDITAVKFGKAAFSLRVVSNESLNVMTRMDAAVAVLESAVGQEQLMQALEIAPDFFDDVDTMRSFFDAYTTAVHGASSGESRAS